MKQLLRDKERGDPKGWALDQHLIQTAKLQRTRLTREIEDLKSTIMQADVEASRGVLSHLLSHLTNHLPSHMTNHLFSHAFPSCNVACMLLLPELLSVLWRLHCKNVATNAEPQPAVRASSPWAAVYTHGGSLASHERFAVVLSNGFHLMGPGRSSVYKLALPKKMYGTSHKVKVLFVGPESSGSLFCCPTPGVSSADVPTMTAHT